MLSSQALKKIVTEARPIIERQLDDAERIAWLRDMVAANGGDWSALKALIKAQIQDERDESGEGKRVRKILDKAEYSTGYAELLGWSNMNEQNFSGEPEHDPETGEITEPQSDSNASAAQTEPGHGPGAASAVAAPASVESAAPIQSSDELGHVAMTAADHGPTVTGDPASNGNTGGENVESSASARPAGQEPCTQPPGIDGGNSVDLTSGPDAKRASNFSISPLEPRQAGNLKGFGFTVNFGSECETHLPEIPDDFKSDQSRDVIEARMRRTLKARPGCKRPWSCGRMADQSECAQCLKAAQEMVA